MTATPRQQALDQRPRRRRAEQHGFLPAAHIEQTIGKYVAALDIAGELHLVDRHEGDIEIARHRLHRCHPIAGVARHDLLLAGHQSHRARADAGDDPAIDLARQEAQRQANGP